jgi:hypothetical protein
MQTVRSPSKLPDFPNSWVDPLNLNAIASILQPQDGLFDPWLSLTPDRLPRVVRPQR